MADLVRRFSEYAKSGEIAKVFIGGKTSNDEVITRKDLLRTKAEMSTQTTYDQPMVKNTEYVVELDTVTISRGIITDVTNNTMTVTNTGLYEIFYGIDVGSDNNEEISLEVVVNGTHENYTTIYAEGRGRAKPIPITWKKSIQLNAGDVVTLGIVSLDTNMTSRIFKAILVIKEDR